MTENIQDSNETELNLFPCIYCGLFFTALQKRFSSLALNSEFDIYFLYRCLRNGI
jgi:hypothetical protein